MGVVRAAEPGVPRAGVAAPGHRPRGGGAGFDLRLGPLHREARRHHWHAYVRRLGAPESAPAQVRVHPRTPGRGGPGTGCSRQRRCPERGCRMTPPRSDVLVFFGATGDLAYKQIFPALQALMRHGRLDMPVVGVARSGWSLEQLRARAKDSLEHHGGLDPTAFARLCSRLRYVDGDYRDPATFTRLRQALGGAQRPLHYLAIPPSLFATVAEGLAQSGCARDARVVVEKPFGRDLASARELNRVLHASFPEDAIFRIDHYLGKEPVQNLIYFRFANPVVEASWDNRYVESVHITMAESFGVAGRGKFYEEAGAMRDVVQNHMLQVIACLAMECPAGKGHE